jgi:hypothetical protein
MSTSTDKHIFVTGIVGRAMGSGKFDADEILRLTERANDAFDAVFGKIESASATSPNPYTAPAPSGVMPDPVLPETLDFGQWKGDFCYYGKKEWLFEPLNKPFPHVTWEELLTAGKTSDQRALKALHVIANDTPSTNPQWAAGSRKKIARAKAVLLMVKNG